MRSPRTRVLSLCLPYSFNFRHAIVVSGVLVILLAGCQEYNYTGGKEVMGVQGADSQKTETQAQTQRPAQTINLAAQTETVMPCNSQTFFTDTVWADRSGDSMRMKFTFFCLEQAESIPRVHSRDRCRFDVKEEKIENFGLKIQAYRNKGLLFEKILQKKDFAGLLDRKYIQYNVLASAQLYSFLPQSKNFIVTVSMAQQPGGTNWFAQVYLIFNQKGEEVGRGLVDYPHHCEGVLSVSPNREYILTCSELQKIGGAKKSFRNANVTMARFLSDSAYALIFDLYRDSLLCDTMIYWKNDTLTFSNFQSKRDSISPNAFIMHVNGDTLHKFQFNGYIDAGEGYFNEFLHRKELNLAAFYDSPKRILRIFDLKSNMKEYVFKVKYLKHLPRKTQYRTYIQFYTRDDEGESCKIRFYLNGLSRIYGYTYIY